MIVGWIMGCFVAVEARGDRVWIDIDAAISPSEAAIMRRFFVGNAAAK